MSWETYCNYYGILPRDSFGIVHSWWEHRGNSLLRTYSMYVYKCCTPCFRRVHVTRATLMELGGRFEVEDGNGGDRDEVLAKLGVETFLIIPPKVTST